MVPGRVTAVAEGLAERGLATLRFQFPYMEQGGKRPDPPKLAQATIRAAVAEAVRIPARHPLIAGGKSFGGRMTSQAQATAPLPGVRGLAFLGFPLASVDSHFSGFRCTRRDIHAGGKSFGGRMTSQAQATAPLPGVRGLAFLGFPLHPAGHPSQDRGRHLIDVRIPMLFLQGTRDTLATVDQIEPLRKSLGERATLKLFEGADHSFRMPARTGRKDAQVWSDVLDALVAWTDVVGHTAFAHATVNHRRVDIPKEQGKFRTLQIPCIRDRVVQGALKLILEAIFEADFCPNSYGFRPKRSPHRALAEVRRSLMRRMTTVIDVDLAKYFDNVRHDVLSGPAPCVRSCPVAA